MARRRRRSATFLVLVWRRLQSFLGARSRAEVVVLCLALVALVGAADYRAHLELSLDLFYLIPVSVAAWFLGFRPAVVFSLIGAGIWFAADYLATPSYAHPLIPYWNATIILGFLLLTVAALTAIRIRVEHEMELATEIQSRLVPERLPHLDGVDLAWQWRPADAIGGDYFDVLPFADGSLGVCIADAIGHGIPAALLMANLQSAVRTLALPERRPADLCDRLNAHLQAHLPSGRFFTLWYCLISPPSSEGRALVYANAGHNPVLLVAPDGRVTRLQRGGPLLGIRAGSRYESEEVAIEPGSRLVLYTDGVTELANRDEEQFGLDRLIDVVSRHRSRSAKEMVAAIEDAMQRFTDRTPDDDVTILALAID